MQLRQCQKKTARSKGISKRIHLPCGTMDSHGLKQPWHEIGNQITSRPSLHQNAGKIRTHVVVYEMRTRLIHKRDLQGQLHPVFFLIKRALLAHEVPLFLSEAHGKQIAHLCLCQIVADRLRKFAAKNIHQLFVQGKKPLLQGKAHRAGGIAL